MRDKIGILTFHRTTNFGSCLQTYGLYRKVTDLGYDCEIIDYRCPAIEQRENLSRNTGKLSVRNIVKYILFQRALNEKARSLGEFTREKMKTSEMYEPGSINRADSVYPKIIVGSDLVWALDITGDDFNYFLEFVHGREKKYAFSSSVGGYEKRDQDGYTGKLLADFSRVAVREREAAQWVRNISGVGADWVCDPTMLLTEKEWEKEFALKRPAENYVLVYFNDPSKKTLSDAVKYAAAMHKKVMYINYGVPLKTVRNIRPRSLDEFLSWIYYADRVFTASYHGMLFSIYFRKEFLFYKRAHSARVLSLADRLGLLEQCADDLDVEKYRQINYAEVGRRVEQFRQESLDILKTMLKE